MRSEERVEQWCARMDRVPFAISQSNVDKGKSIENSKRELSW